MEFNDWMSTLPGAQQYSDPDAGSTWWGPAGAEDGRFAHSRSEGFLSPYQSAYSQLTTPDASGRLPYGTNISGIGLQGGELPFSRGGENFFRLGENPRSATDQNFQPLLSGLTEENSPYDPEQGYLMREDAYRPWRAAAEAARSQHDSQRSFLDKNPFAVIALPLLAAMAAPAISAMGAGAGAGSSFAIPGGMSGLAAGGPISTTMALQSGVPAWLSAGAGAGVGVGGLSALEAGGEVAGGADAFEGGFQNFRPGGAEDLGLSQEQFLQRAMGTSEMPMGANGSSFLSRLGSGFDFSSPSSAFRSVFGPMGGGTNIGGFSAGISPFDIGKGLYGLYNSKKTRDLAEKYAAQADPFGPYRGQFGQMVSDLGRDPSSIFKMPGYQAGEQALRRALYAKGEGGGGTEKIALQKYGGDFYNNALNTYSQLAGAGFNPANAGQIGMSGNIAATNLAGQSLNSLGYGFSGGAGRSNPANAELIAQLLRGAV